MEESCEGSQSRYSELLELNYYGDSYIQVNLEGKLGKQLPYCVCTNSLASSFIRWCTTGVNVDFSGLRVHFHMTVCCVPSLLLFFAHTGHLIYSPSYRAKPVRLTDCRTQFIRIFLSVLFLPIQWKLLGSSVVMDLTDFHCIKKKNVF